MKNIYKILTTILFIAVGSIAGFAQTEVQFSSASSTITEDGTSYNLTLSITGEDATNATLVDVALTTGDAADINSYVTQTVTFPAASAVNQTVTITITDDATVESAETLTFTLQNVSGGNSAVIGAQATFDLTIIENDITASDLIINEINADPAGGLAGDANGDGVRSASNDEFIEFVNTGVVDLDISGYELFDTNSSIISRHIFPASTVIPAGGAIVIFGGGTPTGTFGNSIVQTASSGGVGTTNTSETLIIQDASDNTIIYYTYGAEGGNNESITRDPDITGSDTPMVGHSAAIGSGGALYSPGTKIDGTFFIIPTATEVQFSSATASVNEADGTYDIIVSILGEDATNATTVDIALTTGDATDINSYVTETVTFAAGSAANQTVTLIITDDSDIEGDEDLVFTLQNVTGGSSAIIGTQTTHTLTIVDNDFATTELVLNEFLPYPSSTSVTDPNEVDANGDGTLGGTSDEFIELVNAGVTDLDISGWKINDGADRHIFPASTIVPAGGAIVIFAGAPTGTFGNSVVQTASTGGLGLSNGGDTFSVLDDLENTRLTYTYPAATVGVAFTRSPDITGAEPLVTHPVNPTVLNNGGTGATTSPGTKIDGTFFIIPTTTEVQFSSASSTITEDGTSYNLTLSITGEDATNATLVDVALTTGDAADINSYTTQTVTFPAASVADQTVTLTITDDATVESAETLIFTLQNVSGGNSAVIGAQATFDLTIIENDITASDLIINEIHADPASGGAGDANGDGVRSASNDEFIEFVNTGVVDLDISGYELFDTNPSIISRHIFPASTVIPAGGAIVIFGGGTPTGTFGNSIVQTASSGGVGTTNTSETLIIQDASDNTIIYYTYGAEGDNNESITRDPDITGSATPMVGHSTATGSGGALYSPGTKIDGTLFIIPTTTEVQFASATANVNEADGTYDLTVSITGEDATNATVVEVALTSGDATDINSYTTQTVTFAAGSAADQTVTLTITDDTDIEGNEVFTFTLQNVSGGNSAVIGAQSTIDITIVDNDFDATELVVNEFMPWPAGATSTETRFDANGDGTYGISSDEYIELVNSGATDLDISGWKINDGIDRHIFPASTVIPAEGAIIIFGGGTPTGTFGNSIVQTASESSSLGLLNSGDALTINDGTDATRLTFSYGQSTRAVALTRSPDITGAEPFVAHPANATLTNEDLTNATASPGTKIDGTLFIIPTTTEVRFSSSTANVNEADGTFDVLVSIIAEDATNATVVEVALTSGDATDINSYTTQTVTFAAGSAANETVTLTITDDSDIEGDEVLTFTLQNVSGGNSAVIGTQGTLTLTLVDNDFAATDLVLNEFLPYPSSTTITDPNEVDANGDGALGGISDEFIELVNSGTSDLDITGWEIHDSEQLRHKFAPTVLPGGGAVVVFAGGSPTGAFGGAVVYRTESGNLSFTNSGDDIIIKDDTGETKISYSYSSSSPGISYTRNPDITASDFSNHPDLNGNKISPGTMVDGTPFTVDNSTKVEFVSGLGGTSETDTDPFVLALEITNPDATNATTADVVLITADADSDFSYTTQTVTFPAGSSDQQTVSIVVLNDTDLEGDELFSFEIQNVTGGDNARTGINSTFNFFVLDDDVPLIFNEIHADPSTGDAGDANNDGVRDAIADEFIEVINQSTETVDISGWEYHDSSEKRHIFKNGTILEPGRAVVVFGGGIPTGQFGGSDVQLASEGNGLGLINSGEAIKILDNLENLAGGTIYGDDANYNQSVTRSPDITGGYAKHSEADGSGGTLYSPGTKIDGSLFINMVTDIEDQLSTEVFVYPNPAINILNIQLDTKLAEFEFVLLSTNGKEVVSKVFYNTDLAEVDISILPKGLYIYHVKSISRVVNQGKVLIK